MKKLSRRSFLALSGSAALLMAVNPLMANAAITEPELKSYYVAPIFRYREGNDSCYTTMSIKANGDIAPSPYLPLSIGNIRCHTLQEYWDSGYPKIWKLPILKKMASTLNTVDDMQCDSMGYNTWIDRDYSCDIIDEHLME